MPLPGRLRSLVGPVAQLTVGAILGGFGASPDLTMSAVTSVGQLLEVVAPAEQSRDHVIADVANRERRAVAYETYGSAMIIAWQSAGYLVTFRPRIVGYVHGLLALTRAQRRFEEATTTATAALTSVLLYASSDAQQAAIELYRTVGEELIRVGAGGKQGSPRAVKLYTQASAHVGDKMTCWRQAARDDFGTST